jgi:uncharacterized protein with HEPN domain
VKDDEVYLKHIMEAINRIEDYTSGVEKEEFLENSMMQDAVVRQIEIIGEAAKQLSGSTLDEYDLPWSDIAGMRDKLIHNYFGVDIDQVWETLEKDLPELKQKISE